MPAAVSLYEILEVSQTARPAVIRAAYRCLALEFHPDKHPGDREAAAQMSLINQAYAVLSDPVKRDQYDRKMRITTTDRRGSEVTPNQPRSGAGKGRQTTRPFAFRPLD
jgi:curved DNA-binding protein CbpA